MIKKFDSKFFLICLLCSLILFLKLFWTFISSIILSLLIASIFYPLYNRTNKLFKGKKTPASLFICLFILLVLIVPAGWFVGTLSNEAFDFYNRTRNTVSLKQIHDTLNSDSIWAQRIKKIGTITGFEFTPEKVEKISASVGKNVGFFLYNQISSMASNLLSLLLHFFLMLLAVFYLFRDGEQLKEYIIMLLPIPKEQMEKVAEKFQEMGKAVIIGNGLSGIVQGLLGGIGFYIFGLSSPLLWGTIISFMAFLPIIGASIIFIPASVILLVQGNVTAGIGFLCYNFFYSSIIEYLIKPRVIGQGMQMNSLLVFIGIIGGMKLFGILGIVYGPLIITIFLTLAEIYKLEYKGDLSKEA